MSKVPGIDTLSPEREVQLLEGPDKLAADPSFQKNRIKILRDLFAEIRRLRKTREMLTFRVELLRDALSQADVDMALDSANTQINILKALETDARLSKEE